MEPLVSRVPLRALHPLAAHLALPAPAGRAVPRVACPARAVPALQAARARRAARAEPAGPASPVAGAAQVARAWVAAPAAQALVARAQAVRVPADRREPGAPSRRSVAAEAPAARARLAQARVAGAAPAEREELVAQAERRVGPEAPAGPWLLVARVALPARRQPRRHQLAAWRCGFWGSLPEARVRSG